MKTLPPVQVRQAERGQSLVEMALMMTILLTILSAVLDLGRGFFSYIAIQNAAGEGALYAAINPRCPHATTVVPGFNCTNPNNVDFRAKNESPSGGLVDPEQMGVAVFYADGTSEYSAVNTLEGAPIRVQVQYRFRLVGPFSPILPNGELIFTANAVQNILDLKPD
jgi:Flp pilus assembly protein TadG